MKTLILGNGFISEESIRELQQYKFNQIVCCGKSITQCKQFKADKISILLTEARLQPICFWDSVGNIRNENQVYNKAASDIDISSADNVLLVFTRDIFKSRSKMIDAFKNKFGEKKEVEILDTRSLIFQWIKISNKVGLLKDLSFSELLSIVMMVAFNKKIKTLNYDWVSSGIKGIIYSSKYAGDISTAGISFTIRTFGFVDDVKYDYPDKGKTAHLKNDIKFIRNIKNKITIY